MADDGDIDGTREATMDTARFEIPVWESFELLRSRTIGRLCIVEHGYPIAVPINYRIVDADGRPTIVVRTAPDTMLGRYTGLASLEVDEIDLDRATAWSVIVRGGLQRAFGEHHLPDPRPLVGNDRGRWMTLEVAATSGRRFILRPAVDDYFVEWQST
jgi:hypothetical protein